MRTNSLAKNLIAELVDFDKRFKNVNKNFRNEIYDVETTKKILEEYTNLIINKEKEKLWESEIHERCSEIKELITSLRRESSYTVCIMEKYRAEELLTKGDNLTDYFDNIEGCIEQEFREFDMNENSKILLIGIGSFPMTPLFISKNKKIKVVGIDIDQEAVNYAKQVIGVLGKDRNIEVSGESYKDICFTREATHIIIASTIAEKFQILDDLYNLTNEKALVLMRYGNGFKSLFNYPLAESPKSLWKKIDNIFYENNVFDVAVYSKH